MGRVVVRGEVCVDASVAVKWVTPETLRATALALLADWRNRKVQLVGPPFSFAEVDSILRRKAVLVRRPATVPELAEQEAADAFREMLGAPVTLVDLPGQRQRAWDLAIQFGFATVYDATYMALAELRNCEFWTADDKLFERAGKQFPLMRHLADYHP